MCLLILAHHAAPDHRLVVAANRDEFHDRPTAAAGFWPEYPQLLAGRDLRQGGTWMGITRDGRFAALTNFRDPARTAPAPRSRGELPVAYLLGGQAPGDFLRDIAGQSSQYAGFNLLVGDGDELWYFSNSAEAPARPLQPGIYGLSNARLDTPWVKVALGKARLAAVLAGGPLDHRRLAATVSDRELAEGAPTVAATGDGDMDRRLSAQFIVSDQYGTRSTTTLRVTDDLRAHWCEQSYDSTGTPTGLREETLQLQRH